jgi:thiol:disulfide interchange protein DsbD
MPRILILFLLALMAWPLLAEPVQTPHAEAELVAAQRHAEPGKALTVALRLKHEAEWHTYWRNPGDSGMPTRITWELPEGVKAGPILWPVPERIPVGPLTNYGYEGEIFLLTDIAVPANWPAGQPLPLKAKADWLICKEICLPGGTTLTLEVPSAAGPSAPHDQWGEPVAKARAALPVESAAWRPKASVTERNIVIDATLPESERSGVETLSFFPDSPEILDNPSPQTLEKTADGLRLLLVAAPGFTGDAKSLSGLLVAEGPGGRRALQVAMDYPGGAPKVTATAPQPTLSAADIQASASTPTATIGLLMALVLAFGGGVVLNLMPCVFPVVSIKVLGFVDQAHGDRADLRNHGLAFAAGIVVCFWIIAGVLLALRASGEALGWGYQLQSPPIVAALAVLFFVLGLNLSGWFEIGMKVQSVAGNVDTKTGLPGAFLSGMLATAVATPCTAPFMGAALGFALTQPAALAMAVFTALALGMGLPYVVLSLFPALTRWLPRPGRWMETLKQFLAFPLYLTVVWLVWVLGEQLGVTAAAKLLVGLVLLTAAIWAWRRFGGLAQPAGVAFAALLGVGSLWFAWPSGEAQAGKAVATTAGWSSYSDGELDTLRAKGPVFIDFTAAWCVTCQVNKRVVLQSDAVEQAFAARGVARMRADWTHRDEAITRALARLGRSGVPVYVVYPAGGGAPELLPELLTREIVLSALDRAAGPNR